MKVFCLISALVATALVGNVIAAPVAGGALAQRSELEDRGLVCSHFP